MTQAAINEVAVSERDALQEFDISPIKVEAMAKEYMNLTVPQADTKAYREARSALTTCVRTRTGVDKRRKDLGEDARKWIKEVNEAAKQLVAPLAPVEDHLKNELQKEDDRKASIKAEQERIEAERVNKIRSKINDIANMVTSLNGLDSATLEELKGQIGAIEITEDEYQEFASEAARTKHNAIDAVEVALKARIQWEVEESERKALAEKLRKQKEEQEAERKRLEEIRLEQERKDREAKEALEAEQRKFEEEKAAFEQARREQQEETERQKQAEIEEKILKERAEEEVKAKAEAEKADAAREEHLKPDREKLLAWADELANIGRPALADSMAEMICDKALEGIRGVADSIRADVVDKLWND